MSGKKENCFIDEIKIDTVNSTVETVKKEEKKIKIENDEKEDKVRMNRLGNSDKFDRAKQNKKMQQKKIFYQKNTTSNINLYISIIMFFVIAGISLYIVINKGHIGEISLLKNNQMIHTAELEFSTDFLSIIDKEESSPMLTIDGIKIEDGYELSTSDETIAKIENGKVIAGENAGTAQITAYYKLYDMHVSSEVVSYVPINEIKSTVGKDTLKEGEDTTLSLKIQPTDGTDSYITYKSSDTQVATVDKDGKITAVGTGEAEITIKDELTGATNTKTITVK